MNRLKSLVTASLRWSWFGLLVLLAFGYLVAGLSNRPEQTVENQRSQPRPVDTGDDDSIAQAVTLVDQRWTDSLQKRRMQPVVTQTRAN